MHPVFVAHYTKTAMNALNVLAGTLRQDARTRDLDIRFAKTREAVVEHARDASAAGAKVVVGWSFYSPEIGAIVEDLAFVKGALAGLDVVQLAGGVHATAEPRATLEAGFDLVAIGEGEKTIVDFFVALLASEDATRVVGLGRMVDGTYRSTGSGERVELDDYPPFDAPDLRFNAIEITRGCIYACKFCQTPFMFKARFRHRSVGNVRRHVRTLRENRMRYVRFVTPTSLSYGSDDVHPNLDAVEALLAAVREEIGADGKIYFGTFPSEVRPEHVTPEALKILKKWVDNDNLVIGGQSGSQRVLDETRRDHSVDDVVRAVRIAVENGFRPNVDFLFGLPGERDEDARATVKLMRTVADAGARIHTHVFMPLPGTPLKDSPAGSVSPDVRAELGKLEAHGRSYGQWKAQLVSADRLAKRRAL